MAARVWRNAFAVHSFNTCVFFCDVRFHSSVDLFSAQYSANVMRDSLVSISAGLPAVNTVRYCFCNRPNCCGVTPSSACQSSQRNLHETVSHHNTFRRSR